MESKEYIYFVCNLGSEDLLKKEVSLKFPTWRMSFNRPGFLTYISEKKVPNQLHFIFAQRFGKAIGKFLKRLEMQEEIARARKDNTQISILFTSRVVEIHPLETNTFSSNMNGRVYECLAIDEDSFLWGELIHPEKAIKQYLLDQMTLPKEAPSRAYLKIAQMCQIAELKIQSGDMVYEFGSSPGGASYFLVNQGATTVGVDPGQMHENCLSHQLFSHLNSSIQEVKSQDIARSTTWIVSDMNLSPFAVIKEFTRLNVNELYYLKGMILTLKMMKSDMVEQIPDMYKKLERLGFQIKVAKQMPSNHREFMVYAQKI